MMKYLIIALMLLSTPALAGQSTAVIDANETVKVGNCYARTGMCEATLYANGDFGSGTISWYWSIDGGTTKQAIRDLTSVAETSTAEDTMTVNFGTANNTVKNLEVYATMAGSTAADVIVGILTNSP